MHIHLNKIINSIFCCCWDRICSQEAVRIMFPSLCSGHRAPFSRIWAMRWLTIFSSLSPTYSFPHWLGRFSPLARFDHQFTESLRSNFFFSLFLTYDGAGTCAGALAVLLLLRCPVNGGYYTRGHRLPHWPGRCAAACAFPRSESTSFMTSFFSTAWIRPF